MKNTILFLLLVVVGSCYSQDAGLKQGTVKDKEYYAEIPFEYVNGKIILPVKIGSQVYRFLLDTGAPNCISKKLNASLNPKVLQSIEVTDANSNKSLMSIVQIPSMEIGSVVFENAVALSSSDDKNVVFDCFTIDGFIGSNLLRNSIIQIDTKAKLLRITNDRDKLNFQKKNSIKVSLIGDQGSPYIWLKMKEKNTAKEQVLLDTGMSGFYDIATRNYNLLKNDNIIKVLNNGIGTKDISMFGNAGSNEQLRLMIPEMDIANSRFTNVITTTTNDTDSRIGAALFDYGIGTLDFADKKFYFDGYTEGPIDLTEKLAGFTPTIMDGKLSVGIVWDEKLKDKLHTGDAIIEINGKNYENYPICDLITQKAVFKNLEIKEITVKAKNGELLKVTF